MLKNSFLLPSARTRKRVCMPFSWLNPTSVSSSHRPGLDGYISRVAKLPVKTFCNFIATTVKHLYGNKKKKIIKKCEGKILG